MRKIISSEHFCTELRVAFVSKSVKLAVDFCSVLGDEKAMSFSLKPDAPVNEEARRILERQLQKARKCAEASSGSRKDHYHQIRRRLKKARAVLRLIREELGEESYQRENGAYRDIARAFSGARDADVLKETLDNLLEGHPKRNAFRAIVRKLNAISAANVEAALADKVALDHALQSLKEAQDRVEDLDLLHRGWSAIEPGLTRIYSQTRKSMREVYENPSDLSFHEWRKKTKYLRHQIELLQECWPEVLKDFSEQLHLLGNYLGEDHDLSVLRDTLRSARINNPELNRLIDKRQNELRAQAHPLAQRLLAEKPKAFTRRLHRYWRTPSLLRSGDRAHGAVDNRVLNSPN